MSNNQKNYYESLNGVRAFACLGIVVMHVLANGNYALTGLIFERIIPELKDLVFLFMIISGFSTFCGYYQKIKTGEFSLERFYKNRYMKIWPFFALLVVIDVILTPSLNAIYEAFADLTLCFGLLPRSGGGITVIGVGWFLGVVFVYYMIFPFVCFLLENKKRAWVSFGISFIFSYIAYTYFAAERTNIIFCLPFFILGGVVYLYRENICTFSKKYNKYLLLSVFILIPVYYLWITNITRIILYATIIIFALGIDRRGILINSITKKLSEVSLEIYLCHMLVFRIVEKIGFVHLVKSNEIISYIICVVLVFCGATVASIAYKKVVIMLRDKIESKAV